MIPGPGFPLKAMIMRINNPQNRICFVAIFLLLVAFGPFQGFCHADDKESTTRLDCGVNSLFVLLSLEQRPVSIDRLLDSLPARHPEGYSMAELSDAPQSLGLRLEGVRLARGTVPFPRPGIVYLKDERGGHYAVFRPVGTTGTMVQVIDPPFAPWVADYQSVFAAKPWTGQILIASQPWTARQLLLISMACISLTFLVLSSLARRTGVKRGSTPVSS